MTFSLGKTVCFGKAPGDVESREGSDVQVIDKIVGRTRGDGRVR
jgi:hypothetical protein